MSTSIFSRAALATVAAALLAGSVMAAPSEWWKPYTTDANTIGLWHFDDVTGSTGTFADSSGNSNTGTLNSTAGSFQVPVSTLTLTVPAASGAGTGPGAGLFGTALDYDENQNAAVLATGDDENSPFAWGSVLNGGGLNYGNAVTLEAWIKPTGGDLGSPRLTYIAGSSVGTAGFNFGIQDGTLFVDTRDTASVYHYAQQTSVTLVADDWAHVAAVLSNDGTTSTATVYVNGASAATNSWADSALGPASSIFNIGANGSALKWVMFRSQIDEVRLSNVAREFGPAPALPGDYNDDNKVDAADYVAWRKNPGDFPLNAYETWRQNFGNPPGSGSALEAGAVPEPSTAILLQIVGLLCCAFRNSRRSRTPR